MLMQTDLFSDVVVTVKDVENYMLSVGHSSINNLRLINYINTYNVANRIKELKISGCFDNVISEANRISKPFCLLHLFPTIYKVDSLPPLPMQFDYISEIRRLMSKRDYKTTKANRWELAGLHVTRVKFLRIEVRDIKRDILSLQLARDKAKPQVSTMPII